MTLAARFIIHFDIDCFYCQVEHVRLRIPLTVPLAVQQWSNLIAVNYEARKHGISRHDSAREALKKCPTLKLVHVPTFKYEAPDRPQTLMDDVKAEYRELNDKNTSKSCLEAYRRASRPIFEIMKKYGVVEKASIDEAYIDVSEFVSAFLTGQTDKLNADIMSKLTLEMSKSHSDHGVIVGDDEAGLFQDQGMFIASLLGQQIRLEILQVTQFTCTTGIASNKTLAKICSAMNKPNNQTVLPSNSVQDFIKECDLGKIRNFGGKLGDHLKSLGLFKAGDIWKYSHAQLRAILLEAGSSENTVDADSAWLWNICRGICSDKLEAKDGVKSMLSAKAVPIPNQYIAGAWLRILSCELFQRLKEEWDENKRWPKTITIQWTAAQISKSKSTQMTMRNFTTCETLLQRLVIGTLLKSVDRYPIEHISICCNSFKDFSETGLAGPGNQSIMKFRKPVNSVMAELTTVQKQAETSQELLVEEEDEVVYDLSETDEEDLPVPSLNIQDAWNAGQDANAILFKCERCDQLLCRDDDRMIQEHRDFHFAASLDPTFKLPKKKPRLLPCLPIQQKKRKKDDGTTQLKLSSFFKSTSRQ